MNKTGLVILLSLFLSFDKPLSAQQFVNGNLKFNSNLSNYVNWTLYKHGDKYLELYRANSFNCLLWGMEGGNYSNLIVDGLDTLNTQGGNLLFTVYPLNNISNVDRHPDTFAYFIANMNPDTFSNQGYSLQINIPLIKDSIYELKFSARDFMQAAIDSTSTKHYGRNTLWNLDNPEYLKFNGNITQSQNKNELGAIIGSFTRYNVTGKDTLFFRNSYFPDDHWYVIRTRIKGTGLGNYLTIKLKSNLEQSQINRYYSKDPSVLSCQNRTSLHQAYSLYLTSFHLQCPIRILGDTVVCNNSAPTALKLSSVHFDDKFKWSTGDTSASININKPGRYWVEANRGGCMGYDTIDIKIKQTSFPPIKKDTTICKNTPVSIGYTSLNSTAKYIWQDGLESPTKTVNNGGFYVVNIKDSGCSRTDTIIVNELQNHKALLSTTLSVCIDSLVEVQSLIDPVTWWSNGAIISNNNPYNFKITGAQQLVLQTKVNCEQWDTLNIIPIYCGRAATIYIPNAFAPSSMGLNGSFYYVGKGWELQGMKIYNRWGQKLFDAPKAWDGMFMQKEVPEGVYNYIMQFKNTQTNEMQVLSGMVHLFR